MDDGSLFRRFDDPANSIAILVGHLVGNMLSRWTDLLESDGEKPFSCLASDALERDFRGFS